MRMRSFAGMKCHYNGRVGRLGALHEPAILKARADVIQMRALVVFFVLFCPRCDGQFHCVMLLRFARFWRYLQQQL